MTHSNSLVERTEQIVRQTMAGQGAGHGVDHVLRVLRRARVIQASVGGDRLLVELSALLHDIGDAKFHQGRERSGEISREVLGELGAPESLIRQVVHIVDNLSFRKRAEAEELSFEGKIVQDADRLDALGAIGIVRTIEYGASINQPFFVASSGAEGTEESPLSMGIQHFDDKLFQLKAMMNTAIARQMASELEEFMRVFIAQYLKEYEGTAV